MIERHSKFIIKHIDKELGNATVQFINLYGPIDTGEKTEEDFKYEVEIDTGNIRDNGTKIYSTEYRIYDNPNEDMEFNIIIPMDPDTGLYYTKNQFLQHLAEMYPQGEFLERKNRLALSMPVEYDEDIGKVIEIVSTYPEPEEVVPEVYPENYEAPFMIILDEPTGEPIILDPDITGAGEMDVTVLG
jgi:hypothetical protein